MKWKKWLENWDMTSLKIKLKFLEMEWKPQVADKEAAWELYIELLTRSSTQFFLPGQGDEKRALESIAELFGLTREIIKRYKTDCFEFTKIAIVVLNQVIRPFTTKWHGLSIQGAFEDKANRDSFRTELNKLQIELRKFTRMLADMADIEQDLTDLENIEQES